MHALPPDDFPPDAAADVEGPASSSENKPIPLVAGNDNPVFTNDETKVCKPSKKIVTYYE